MQCAKLAGSPGAHMQIASRLKSIENEAVRKAKENPGTLINLKDLVKKSQSDEDDETERELAAAPLDS